MTRMIVRLLILVLLGATVASAQDAVLRTRERAKMLTDFRALLEHTDAATRMAAFEEAMSGKDQALKTMAMDAAMGSTDDNLKTAALRAFLDGRESLPITVILPDRASDGLVLEYSRWNGLRIDKVTVKDNVIGGHYDNRETFKSGQLIPGGIHLIFQYSSQCTLTAKIVAVKQLAGNLDCTHPENWSKQIGARRTVFPIRIDLP